MEKNCIFCKIINKEIPSYKVYEDDYVFAFLDLNPVSKAHTLVIPKKHYKDLLETEDKDLKEIIKITKKLAKTIKQKLNADGINILNNNGNYAGQEVFHLHIHIIPRFKDDNLSFLPKNKIEYDLKETQQKIEIKNEL